MWKINVGLIPDHYNIQFRNSARHGPNAERPNAERPVGKSSRKEINTTIHNGFTSSAIGLFEKVPAAVKSKKTIDEMKHALDKFLSKIPDEPPTRGYMRRCNNSIIDWYYHGQNH